MKRPGPRGAGSTAREDILDAARIAFAADGFDKSTIRRIASDSGVDPALVHHYFGTKADLYAATLEIDLSPELIVAALSDVALAQVGETLVEIFFSVWDDETSRAPLFAMLSGAMTGNDAGLQAFREFIADTVLRAIVSRLEGEDARLRATLAVGHLIGTAIVRHVAKIEPLASASREELTALLAPRVQSYLTP